MEYNLLTIITLAASKKASRFTRVTIITVALLVIGLLASSLPAVAQDSTSNQSLTLQQCIDYAMQHQPVLKQSLINVSVSKATNIINLSGWMPQVNVNGSFVHYDQLPSSYITNPADVTGPKVLIKTGVVNTFIPEFAATQVLFQPSLLYAATSAHLYVRQARQAIDSTKIGIVSSVSKAFYNLLLTLKEIDILKTDTAELIRNYNDAYHQYVGGIVDATDYEEAAITLNNTKAQLKMATENIVPQYALLKQLMGFPPQDQFNVLYDTVEMQKEIVLDTTQQLQYEKRIEYQELQTVRALQHQQTNYYKFSFLPSLSAYYNYNYEFENDELTRLFQTAYPNSLVGLTFNLPIFTGLSRLEGLRRSKLQEHILDWSEVSLKSEIYTEYTSALANYRSNLYNLNILQDNEAMAKKVYYVVSLQYKQGIVPYLNVITAQSNLINSEIGYTNALFQVLESKIDLEQAMGNIPY